FVQIPLSWYCMITLEVPENSINEVTEKDLPALWYQNPPPAALKKIGDQFIQRGKSLALKVPSSIVPEDFNYLFNPNHADFKKIKVIVQRAIPFDDSMKKK